jgi:peptide deformylase
LLAIRAPATVARTEEHDQEVKILAHPNPALKTAASEVDPVTDRDLPRLVKEMAEQMYGAPGVGLAAPQLGVSKRVIVWDISENKDAPNVLCNPRLVEISAETEVDEEGCLSVPGISVPIERAVGVLCEGELITGETVRIEATELLARILQHECDHLDGVLILDRAEPEARLEAIRHYARREKDW